MGERIHLHTANKTLAAYLRGGRLPHALLLEGGSEEDRMVLASSVAQAALCSAPAPERPCGACRDCRKVQGGIHPDFLSYGGEGGARSFHIDTVREVRGQAYVRPGEAQGQVLLLREVQTMSVQAQNALLKSIEEPPAHVTFVLTCDNKASLLETILSRVSVLTLEEAQGSAAPVNAEAAEFLTRACTGSELEALASLTVFERDRVAFAAFLDKLQVLLGVLLLRPDQAEVLRPLAERVGRLRLLRILAIIEDTAYAADQNSNGLLLTTSLCGRIRAAMAAE